MVIMYTQVLTLYGYSILNPLKDSLEKINKNSYLQNCCPCCFWSQNELKFKCMYVWMLCYMKLDFLTISLDQKCKQSDYMNYTF